MGPRYLRQHFRSGHHEQGSWQQVPPRGSQDRRHATRHEDVDGLSREGPEARRVLQVGWDGTVVMVLEELCSGKHIPDIASNKSSDIVIKSRETHTICSQCLTVFHMSLASIYVLA